MTRLRVRVLSLLMSPYLLLAALLACLLLVASMDAPTEADALQDSSLNLQDAQAAALMTAAGRKP